MNPTLDPHDYVARPRDAQPLADRASEVAFEATLRGMPEEERVEFLSKVLVLREKARLVNRGWFALAMRVLESHRSYERLLRDGLLVADASSIKGWIECCVQRIGMRRVVHVLREADNDIPRRVDLTVYWLPRFARTPKERTIVTEFLASRATPRDEPPER